MNSSWWIEAGWKCYGCNFTIIGFLPMAVRHTSQCYALLYVAVCLWADHGCRFVCRHRLYAEHLSAHRPKTVILCVFIRLNIKETDIIQMETSESHICMQWPLAISKQNGFYAYIRVYLICLRRLCVHSKVLSDGCYQLWRWAEVAFWWGRMDNTSPPICCCCCRWEDSLIRGTSYFHRQLFQFLKNRSEPHWLIFQPSSRDKKRHVISMSNFFLFWLVPQMVDIKSADYSLLWEP